ncbi:MAG: sigma 54-interacting transcriptional regulator [Candidatus Marinimicrobia bacterium]|nr:sigma 54-interacting transcriptional regulator [Candidatus Neomarinimicrobiota bacterium]
MKILTIICNTVSPKEAHSPEIQKVISAADEMIKIQLDSSLYLIAVSADGDEKLKKIRAKDFQELNCRFIGHEESIQQIFRLSCGLDLKPLGSDRWFKKFENEILSGGDEAKAGPILSRLFRDVKSTLKRIIASTTIRSGVVDRISASVDLAEKIFGELHDKKALVYGTADFRNEVVDTLTDRGIQSVSSVKEFGWLSDAFKETDIFLIGKSRVAIDDINKDDLIEFLKSKSSPFLILDFGENPKSFSGLSKFGDLYYTQASSLDPVISRNLSVRKDAVRDVEKIIELAIDRFKIWTESDKWDVSKSIVARSHLMQEVFSLIDRVASSNATLLISGETGTGKELVAKAVHRSGPRANKPFVAVNCGAIPENLLESTLFGYVKGAFTGAESDRSGMFQGADGGVLFLDEIAELQLSLQVKLLRVLQDREIQPVGSYKSALVDVRVIAATNKHLFERVERGLFREDLYYRLNVVEIAVPPLRERPEDILALAEHFLKEQSRQNGGRILTLHENTAILLKNYGWPGNVRELQNVIERVAILSTSAVILPSELPNSILNPAKTDVSDNNANQPTLEDVEQDYIKEVLLKHNFNYSKAADTLGIGRTTLWRKMKKYGMDNEDRSNNN